MVSYCDHWMSIVGRVCRQQLLIKRTSPKLVAGFLPNLAGYDPYGPF